MEIHPKRILYVEASDLIQAWVPCVLKKSGWTVFCARDVACARRHLEGREPFDAVLLGDLTRPNELVSGVPLDELSLIESIRQSPLHRCTPIVVFTSYDWLEAAHEAGANQHLIKPAGAEELEKILEPFLTREKAANSH